MYVMWTAGRFDSFGEVKSMPPRQPYLPEEEILGRELPRVAGSVWGFLVQMDLWQGGHGTSHGR